MGTIKVYLYILHLNIQSVLCLTFAKFLKIDRTCRLFSLSQIWIVRYELVTVMLITSTSIFMDANRKSAPIQGYSIYIYTESIQALALADGYRLYLPLPNVFAAITENHFFLLLRNYCFAVELSDSVTYISEENTYILLFWKTLIKYWIFKSYFVYVIIVYAHSTLLWSSTSYLPNCLECITPLDCYPAIRVDFQYKQLAYHWLGTRKGLHID